MLFVVFRGNATAVFVGTGEVKKQYPCEFGLQFCRAVDVVVVPIEYGRLIKRTMVQGQIVGQPLCKFWSDGDTVIVVGKHGVVSKISSIVNKSRTDGIVAIGRLRIDLEF